VGGGSVGASRFGRQDRCPCGGRQVWLPAVAASACAAHAPRAEVVVVVLAAVVGVALVRVAAIFKQVLQADVYIVARLVPVHRTCSVDRKARRVQRQSCISEALGKQLGDALRVGGKLFSNLQVHRRHGLVLQGQRVLHVPLLRESTPLPQASGNGCHIHLVLTNTVRTCHCGCDRGRHVIRSAIALQRHPLTQHEALRCRQRCRRRCSLHVLPRDKLPRNHGSGWLRFHAQSPATSLNAEIRRPVNVCRRGDAAGTSPPSRIRHSVDHEPVEIRLRIEALHHDRPRYLRVDLQGARLIGVVISWVVRTLHASTVQCARTSNPRPHVRRCTRRESRRAGRCGSRGAGRCRSRRASHSWYSRA